MQGNATAKFGSDRANNNASLDWRDSISGVLQVFDIIFYTSFWIPVLSRDITEKENLQFKEREVCVAIICLLIALVLDVILEDSRRLWVISVESIKDRLNMIWALWRVIERNTHDADGWGRGETGMAGVGGGRGIDFEVGCTLAHEVFELHTN